jgi:hypothetical protein
MLNFAYWKKLLAKFLRQLVPIAFNFKGRKWVPRLCFADKWVGKGIPFEPFIGNSFLTHRVASHREMPYVSIWVLRVYPFKWGCRRHLDDPSFDFILGRFELRIWLLYFYVFTLRTSVILVISSVLPQGGWRTPSRQQNKNKNKTKQNKVVL